MKEMIPLFLALLLVITAPSLASGAPTTPGSKDFSTITAFPAKDGRLGFFDQSTGKIYIYDSEGKACLFEGQLKELGKPFEIIQKTTSAPAIKRKMDSGTKVMINNKGEKTVILDGSQN